MACPFIQRIRKCGICLGQREWRTRQSAPYIIHNVMIDRISGFTINTTCTFVKPWLLYCHSRSCMNATICSDNDNSESTDSSTPSISVNHICLDCAKPFSTRTMPEPDVVHSVLSALSQTRLVQDWFQYTRNSTAAEKAMNSEK